MPQSTPSEPRSRTAADQAQLARQLAALGAETRTERHVKRVLPWVISLAIHLAVGMLALFITWTVANLPEEESAELIVADFNAMTYEPVASLRPTEQSQAEPLTRDLAPALPPVELLIDQVRQSQSDPMKALADAAFGGGSPGASAFTQLAPQVEAGQVRFAGVSGSNAQKIVYAIDASGSMIAHLQIVIDELARSLGNLTPRQSFAVIFFQDDRALQVPPEDNLISATASERDRTLRWIKENIVPRGGTNPLVAFRQAIKLQPDVIFLLSQDITGYGQFEVDQAELLELLDELNPPDPHTGRRFTQINCIQFLDEDPLHTMKAIAQRHGGAGGYKFLSRKELGLGE